MDTFISAGVAGHVDHGKTTLVRCLTGIDTDRLREEKRRGLSIEPSVAPLQLPSGGRISLVDVPGHSDFLKNTIRGLSAVDLAILVVAADDGVMPQTRDHLHALKFLKAKGGFIVLSKADLVDSETLELAEMELQELLEGSFLAGKPVVPFSAANSTGLDRVVSAIQKEAETVAAKPPDAPFRLWVDQVRCLAGFGTVVSGTVLSGSIGRDDSVELLPSGKQARVRFMEVHHQRVDRANAGQRVGLNLHAVSVGEVGVGTALAVPGLLRPTRLLNAEVSLLPTARRPVVSRQRVRLHIGTSSVTALLVTMETQRIHPGETGLAQLRLKEPLAVLPRDSFVISPMNLNAITGGGRILEAPDDKFRSSKADKILAYLQPLRCDDAKRVVSHFLGKHPNRPVPIEEITRATGLQVERIRTSIKSGTRAGKLIHIQDRGYFDKARYDILKTKLIKVAEEIFSSDALKAAASVEELRFRVDANLDNALVERMIQELCAEEKLVKSDEGYRIPGLPGEPAFRKGNLVRRLTEFAKNQRYSTFSVGTFWELHGNGVPYGEVKRIIDRWCGQKKLVRLNDGRFMSSEAMIEIQDRVKELIQRKGSLSVHDSREVLGYGRTRAIPVWDYLDDIGFTRRIGDERVLIADGNSLHRVCR